MGRNRTYIIKIFGSEIITFQQFSHSITDTYIAQPNSEPTAHDIVENCRIKGIKSNFLFPHPIVKQEKLQTTDHYFSKKTCTIHFFLVIFNFHGNLTYAAKLLKYYKIICIFQFFAVTLHAFCVVIL